MNGKIKCGPLMYFHRGFFTNKWKDGYFVLLGDSTLQCFHKQGDKKPVFSVTLNDVCQFIRVGEFTRGISGRPQLPAAGSESTLVCFPKNRHRKTKEVYWVICPDKDELNDWMIAVAGTLKLPPKSSRPKSMPAPTSRTSMYNASNDVFDTNSDSRNSDTENNYYPQYETNGNGGSYSNQYYSYLASNGINNMNYGTTYATMAPIWGLNSAYYYPNPNYYSYGVVLNDNNTYTNNSNIDATNYTADYRNGYDNSNQPYYYTNNAANYYSGDYDINDGGEEEEEEEVVEVYIIQDTDVPNNLTRNMNY